MRESERVHTTHQRRRGEPFHDCGGFLRRMCSSRSCFSSTGLGALRQQVLRALGLREGDHVADRLGAGHQRDEAVEAERDAAVRRRAVLQRVEQEAELRALSSSAPIFSARNTLLCTSSRWIRTEPPPSSQPFSTMS